MARLISHLCTTTPTCFLKLSLFMLIAERLFTSLVTTGVIANEVTIFQSHMLYVFQCVLYVQLITYNAA